MVVWGFQVYLYIKIVDLHGLHRQNINLDLLVLVVGQNPKIFLPDGGFHADEFHGRIRKQKSPTKQTTVCPWKSSRPLNK